MITGFWISQAIYAAAKLRIADLVKEESKHCGVDPISGQLHDLDGGAIIAEWLPAPFDTREAARTHCANA
jgi:hypothetical protein